jgi:predicted nucleic acid-binding Zn ribbon protein
MEYKCEQCGNETLFYSEVSVVAKQVYNQKKDIFYIREKSNVIDNAFHPVYCYKCNHCVESDM